MKKRRVVVSGLVMAMLMGALFTGTVLARGPWDGDGTQPGAGMRRATPGMAQVGGGGRAFGFVDEDDDGVNDRYLHGDGVPDHDGAGLGYGYGFLDGDDDGVNDRYLQGDGVPDYDGAGVGYGYGFVDENEDGVNDRYVDGECTPLAGESMGQRGGRWSR